LSYLQFHYLNIFEDRPMRILHFLLLMFILLPCTAGADQGAGGADQVETIIFPPLGCGADSPFVSWDGKQGQTLCQNGQTILKNALPACSLGQYVSFDGQSYVCRTVPTCGANELLSYDGSAFECRNTNVPTCAPNQVLTFDGNSYTCVRRTDDIPTCAANQFLTYNGSYQCSTVQAPSIPNCAANEVVTGDGSQLSCAPAPPSSWTTSGPHIYNSNAGFVGIGTPNPGELLDVNGTVKAVDILLTSDRRQKRDITELNRQDALQKLLKLRPVAFRWKKDNRDDMGVIAQELQPVFPELVNTNRDGSLSIRAVALIAPLIASVQELNARVEKLEKENTLVKNSAQSTSPAYRADR
jgi:hypothetical protein